MTCAYPKVMTSNQETFAPLDQPLYEIKADLFRGLAHPVRIRILEIVTAAPETTVSELLAHTGLKGPNLSQHLSVLRNYGLVSTQRRASHVYVSASHSSVAGLLSAARTLLSDTLGNRATAGEQA